MDGIFSKTYPPPVLEQLPISPQEAGPPACIVTSIPPTRYISETQRNNPFSGTCVQQSVGKVLQEMKPSTIHTAPNHNDASRHTADSQQQAQWLIADDTTQSVGIKQKKTDATHSENIPNRVDNHLTGLASKPANKTTPQQTKRQDKGKPGKKKSTHRHHTINRNNKNRAPANQIKNKKSKKQIKAFQEQRRRQVITELYSNIENVIRDITSIGNKPSKKLLLSACIRIVKKNTQKNHTSSNAEKTNRSKNTPITGIDDNHLRRNHYERGRRREIRQLILDLRKAIHGSTDQKRNERATLQDFLLFVTKKQGLKKTKSRSNCNSATGVKTTDPLSNQTNTIPNGKESVSSDKRDTSPMSRKMWQHPQDMCSTLNHSQPSWFAESISQLLEDEYQYHESQRLKNTGAHPLDELESTIDTHSPITPCPSFLVPGPPEQNKQEKTYPLLPDSPSPPATCMYQPQTFKQEERYPAEYLPMMMAVPPREIFQWTPCQHLQAQVQNNAVSSASGDTIEPKIEPKIEDVSSSDDDTLFNLQQLSLGEIASVVDEMSDPSPLGSTQGILPIGDQYQPLITDLKIQVSDLKRSRTDLRLQLIQNKTLLDGELNKNFNLSRKAFNLEQEVEMLRKENAQCRQTEQLVENLIRFTFQDEQRKIADLYRSQTNLEHQQRQTETLLHGVLNDNLQLLRKAFNLEQELEMLRKENARLQQKDR
ncbi:hypothetical protein [Endozoicomonas sp. SCSIO W0465]|uniref:hypothetical protein n=1 Tax=Endozoicomonas sp. SCSIO W0465 TaxID=2918516 RepID=UPI00207533C2|nr:hypothetical protein [Endozoicomonas sp. SCSIO W0465]USE38159.1 hypothetical protein MJO57_08315 [Endozoicomonas sp. SCSIO W0465]